METQQATGTTLEILQGYFAHKIEVDVRYADVPDVDRGHLVSLRLDDPSVEVQFPAPGKFPFPFVQVHIQPSECLPVLYAFEDLIKQMPDGTVPAVTLAKLIFQEEDYTYVAMLYTAKENGGVAKVEVIVSENGSNDYQTLVVYEGWGLSSYYTDEDGAEEVSSVSTDGAWDILRSMHIAVNLEPHQFIRKTQ